MATSDESERLAIHLLAYRTDCESTSYDERMTSISIARYLNIQFDTLSIYKP